VLRALTVEVKGYTPVNFVDPSKQSGEYTSGYEFSQVLQYSPPIR
jgi:hypothetical protein